MKKIKKIKYYIIAPVMVLFCFLLLQNVKAIDFNSQIKNLESQNENHGNTADMLRKKADSLSGEVSVLESEKNNLQKLIGQTSLEIKKLEKEIIKTEQEIEHNKDLLGEVLADLAIAKDKSLLERITTSQSIGDFFDKEAQLDSLQTGVKAKNKIIRDQRSELKTKKSNKSALFEEQNLKKQEIIAKETEKQNLLSQTKNDEQAYKNLIQSNNKKIEELREQQRLANLKAARGRGVVAGDPNRGGYPAYLDYPHAQDSLVDPWGMYNRECVSYTAWKVHQSGKRMPYWGGRGNAKQWPSSARTDGIKTGSVPKVGSVAIWMHGYYGHAMWVERINKNGTVHVSQYNFNVDGRYSEMDINANSAIYIYF